MKPDQPSAEVSVAEMLDDPAKYLQILARVVPADAATAAVLSFARSLFSTQLAGQHCLKQLVGEIQALLSQTTTEEAPQSPNEKLTEEQVAGGKDNKEKPDADSAASCLREAPMVRMAESVQQTESVISVEQKASTKEQDVQRKKSSTSLDNCVSETKSTQEQGTKRKKSSTSLDNCVSETANTKEQGIKRKKSSASLDNCVSEAASTCSDGFDNESKQEIKQSSSLQERIAALGGNGPALVAWKRQLDAMQTELRKEYAVYSAAKDLSDSQQMDS